MPASNSIVPRTGFTRFTKEGSSSIASGLILQDANGKDWYIFPGANGELRIADAVTAEASGFSFTTGGLSSGLKMAKVALGALDTGGGVLSWANPEAGSILVFRLLIDVTTKSTGAATVDFGATAVSATTSSDTMIDGLDVGTAAGLFNDTKNAGTNGVNAVKVAVGKWITGSRASGACAGLVGSAYIFYVDA